MVMCDDRSDSAGTRVSVALCTFNGARFLREQLSSLAGQSRAVDEIVICDDGSTDATPELLREFARGPGNAVRWEINKSRLGVTRNFEKAISLCTGDIIFLADQDDRWHLQKVEKLLKRFQDKSVGLTFSNGRVGNSELSPAGYRLWDSVWFDSNEQQRVANGDALPVLLRHAVAVGATVAFRASYLPLVLPIPDFPHSHDIWIALLIACVARLDPLNEDLIQYRLHASNVVGLRRYGLLGQIRMARKQVAIDAFQYAADFHEAAYQRLAASQAWNVNPDALRLLREKVRHSLCRHHLPKQGLSRLRAIAGELRRGNYSKYSYGYKSLLQDLFLR